MERHVPEVLGHGPRKWIILHGWFGPAVFDEMRSSLPVDGHQFAILHNPGYGDARDHPVATDITDLAHRILQIVDGLGWERFGIIGHSYGGAAALRIATLVPDRVEAVLGLAPVMPSGFDTIAAANVAAGEDFLPALRGGHAKGPEARDGMLGIAAALDPTLAEDGPALERFIDAAHRSMTEAAYRQYLEVWTGCSFSSDIAGLPVRTLFVLGRTDPFCAPNYVQETVASMGRNARWSVVDGGHFPTLSGKEDVMAEIMDFIAE